MTLFLLSSEYIVEFLCANSAYVPLSIANIIFFLWGRGDLLRFSTDLSPLALLLAMLIQTLSFSLVDRVN